MVMHTFNIVQAQEFSAKVQLHPIFLRKSLGTLINSAQISTFVFGWLAAAVYFAHDIIRTARPDFVQARSTLDQVSAVLTVQQSYFQAILILQRVHIINAYAIGADAVTFTELLARRWPEIVVSVASVTVSVLTIAFKTQALLSVAVLAALLWIVVITVMDVVVSITTFNKLHRMLNTQQTAVQWYWQGLRGSRWHNSSSSSRRLNAIDGATTRLIRSWTVNMLAVLIAVLVYAVGWYLCHGTDEWIPFMRMSWLLGAIWQRGSMLYIEAIKQVALRNRATKQYLGSATHTGIALEGAKSVQTKESGAQ
ncbi:hypothetical protein RI367_003098 [Sorochytrium milnesiophthora]